MASSAHHLFLFAFAFVAIATRGADAWGDRLFFSKTTRTEAVEPGKAASTTTVVPEAADPKSVPSFSRPSSGSTRGYGLYGRPEDNYPPAYFRRGVHRNAEKPTTTNVPTAPEEEAVPVKAGGEGAEPSYTDNGSGRGRPMSYPDNRSGRGRPMPYPDNGSGRGRPMPYSDNGSGRGRPMSYSDNGSGTGRPMSYAAMRGGQQQQHYGMSDTRLYQNGRYYYDVDTGKYGYGYESNPVRTRPEEESGSGYGRPGERRGRYGNAAGYEYGTGNEFGDGVVENGNGFPESQNGQYIP